MKDARECRHVLKKTVLIKSDNRFRRNLPQSIVGDNVNDTLKG